MSEHIHYHKDGSVWAKGQIIGGLKEGYWEWFRKPALSEGSIGTKMRSGYFKKDQQIDEWITYDKLGEPYKITNFDKNKGSQV